MTKQKLPRGWSLKRVQRVLVHYENQTDDEAIAEDDAAFLDPTQSVMTVPKKLVPQVRRLIAKHEARRA